MQTQFDNPHIQDLHDLTSPLLSDLEFCRSHLHGENSMFWKRAFARSTCAYIEGTLSALRRFALDFAEHQVPPNLGKISVLRMESYWPDDDGIIQKRTQRTPRLRHLATIFQCYAESLGSTYQLDRKGIEWQSLAMAFKVRDRITHPETSTGLEISDAETLALEEAFCFFWNSLAYLWNQALSFGKRKV